MSRDLHFPTNSSLAGSIQYIMQVREFLHLPQQAQLDLTGLFGDNQSGHTIEYAVLVPIQLHGSEYGIADGVTVDQRTVAKLHFDAAGNLISSDSDPADERQLQLVRDQVKKLVASGQVAPAGSKGSSGGKNKPWFVETDAFGVKRLKRAHIS